MTTRAEDILQKWYLETGEAVRSVGELAKAIRAATKAEKDHVVVEQELEKRQAARGKAERDLIALINRQASADREANARMVEMSTDAAPRWIQSLTDIKSAWDMVSSAGRQFIAFMDDAARTADIIDGFTGSLEGLRRATAGEVGDLELMRVSNRAAEAEMELTAEQLDAVAKVAHQAAEATGKEFAGEMDKLIGALAAGQGKFLKLHGVIVDVKDAEYEYARAIGKSVKELTEEEKLEARRTEALKQIVAKSKEAADEIDTLANNWDRARAKLDNYYTRVKFWAMQPGVSFYASDADREAALRKTLAAQAEREKAAGWQQLSAGTGLLATGYAGALAGTAKGGGGTGEEYWRGARVTTPGYYWETGTKKGKTAAGAKEGSWWWDPMMKDLKAQQKQAEAYADLEQWEKQQNAMANAKASMAEYKKELQGVVLEHQRFRAPVDEMSEALTFLENRFAEQTIFDSLSAIGEMGTNAFTSLAGGIWEAADAALTGNETFGMAMAKMLKTTLFAIAQEATVRSLFEFAMAAASFMVPPVAAGHAAAGAMFAAVALSAGAGGLAMSAAGVGASSSSSKSSGSSSESYKPSYGSAAKESEQKFYISLYFDDKKNPAAMYVSEELLKVTAKRKAA